jgi:phenylacetate-coenzyme A ligase PaaK-like adenylate-forming protein
MLHTHLHIYLALARRAMGKAWKPVNSKALMDVGEHWIQKYFHNIKSSTG